MSECLIKQSLQGSTAHVDKNQGGDKVQEGIILVFSLCQMTFRHFIRSTDNSCLIFFLFDFIFKHLSVFIKANIYCDMTRGI